MVSRIRIQWWWGFIKIITGSHGVFFGLADRSWGAGGRHMTIEPVGEGGLEGGVELSAHTHSFAPDRRMGRIRDMATPTTLEYRMWMRELRTHQHDRGAADCYGYTHARVPQ